MLQECKYRLPCGRCDKYDGMCEAVLSEIYKEKQEENKKPEKCEHEWISCGLLTIKNPTVTKSYLQDGKYNFIQCVKCGETKIEPFGWR